MHKFKFYKNKSTRDKTSKFVAAAAAAATVVVVVAANILLMLFCVFFSTFYFSSFLFVVVDVGCCWYFMFSKVFLFILFIYGNDNGDEHRIERTETSQSME